jgi:hypothetical protein
MLCNERGHIHLLATAFVILLVVMFWPYITGERGIKLVEMPAFEASPNEPRSSLSPGNFNVSGKREDVLKLASLPFQARYRAFKFQSLLAEAAWDAVDEETRQRILSGAPAALQNNRQLFESMLGDTDNFKMDDFANAANSLKSTMAQHNR